MKLDAEALAALAGCISRGERPDIETLPFTQKGLHCDTCGCDTAAIAPIRVISPSGVRDAGTVEVCAICFTPEEGE